MRAWKFLNTGRIGPYSGFKWPRRKWVVAEGEIGACRNGIHACQTKDLPDWIADELWEMELVGEIQKAGNKIVGRKGRLVRRLKWDKTLTRLFAADCAERALNRVGNPDLCSVRAVWISRAFAFGLVDDAAWAAWDAARDAAWAAARAAWDAAWAARAAAWAAARDAGAAERKWQGKRILDYGYGRVDLDKLKARTEKWLEEDAK